MEARGIHRRLSIEVTDSLRKRLAAGIERRGDGECWPWTGSQRNGYGAIKHQGRVLGTHCVSFVVANGPIPDGRLVTHDCDNRLCCNPAHLTAGTAVSNVREMYARIAMRKARGEMMQNAKLTDELVRFIFAAKVVHGSSNRRIASELGLRPRLIDKVVSRQAWSHVAIPTRQEAAAIIEAFAP